MLTLDIYAFEDRVNQTIVRTLNSGGKFILIQDGQEIARYSCHRNHPLSLGQNGLLLFDNGKSGASKQTLNLRKTFPQEPEPTFSGEILSTDGESLWGYFMDAYPYEDLITGKKIPGVVRIDRKTGKGEKIWHGDTSHPIRIHPFGKAVEDALSDYSKKNWKPVTESIEFPQLFVSRSGQSWALGKPNRLELGVGRTRKASVYWEEFDFSYARAAFAPEEDRLILADKPGLMSVSLEGEVTAHWQARMPCEPKKDQRGRTITEIKTPVVSPPLFWGEDLLVVLQVFEDKRDYPYQCWYEVHRFDPITLTHRGQLEGFPRRRLGDEASILLPLHDGGLAWVPNNERILILPGASTQRRSTPLVEVIGDELPPRIPHPEDDWYDPQIGAYGSAPPLEKTTAEERKSLARFLLNELVKDYRFEALVKMDPDAFKPYQEMILGWPKKEMEHLRNMDFRNYWKISRGASDEAIQKLADRIDKKLPEIHLEEFELLLGAETPLAMNLAADFARQSPLAARRCREHHLWIPEEGPAVPRYIPNMLEIVAYPQDAAPGSITDGLVIFASHEDYLPEGTGWACNAPIGHLLTARLALIPGNPLGASPLKFQHWFLSTCEEQCDEQIDTNYVYEPIDGDPRRVKLTGNLLSSEPRPPKDQRDDSPGYEEQPEETLIVRAEPYSPEKRHWSVKSFGQLGGFPNWWQSPEVPDCPKCGKMMFFVGQVHASGLRDDMMDAMLYGFHCEDSGIAAQVYQIT